MNKRKSTYKSQWITYRRKVCKFLTNLETLPEEDVDEQAKQDVVEESQVKCSRFEWDGTQTSCVDFQSAEVCATVNSEASGSVCGSMHSELSTDCELMWSEPEKRSTDENCWTIIDAEVEMRLSDSESDCDCDEQSSSDVTESLAHWACVHNVTHSALNDLLKILKLQGLSVPLTAQSLQKPPEMSQ